MREKNFSHTLNVHTNFKGKNVPLKEVVTINLLSPTAMSMNMFYIPAVVFLNSNAEQLASLIMVMMIDFLTGLMKAQRLCKKFTGYKFRMGIYMKFASFLLPFLFALTAKEIGYDITLFIPFCISTLILIEIYSIIGNIYTIRTGKELEDKDLLSFFLLSTRNAIDKHIENNTKKD